jgi:pimeloyl-ACP methyl ester carboxylesterase
MQPFPGLAGWARQAQLPLRNIHLFLYDTGEDDKPPVLLLHGLGDEADTWRHVLPALQPCFRVIAPDLPGFGRSDQGKRKYSIPFFVDTVLGLLDCLALSRVTLVGHSNGALVAQEFALEHPERVERLVLISGSLVMKENRIDARTVLSLIPGLGERFYNELRKAPQAAYRSLEPYYNRLEDLPQADRVFLYQRVNERVWSDGQRQGYLSTMRSLVAWIPAQQKKLPSRLKGWNIPTTVIWGENDRVNPVANAHALLKLLPSARLVLVPGAGHNLHQEKPAVVAEAISNGCG